MARDSGRYDAITDTWIDDNVRIDFAWGNIPIQPNDDRGEDTLDPELDSHIIATDGWSSFPEFEPNVGFDVQTVVVPNVVDFDSVSAAEQALLLSELVLGTVTTSTDGATTGNWGWVKSQSPAASTSVAPGTAVNLVSYEYVSSATTGPIAGFTRNGGPMGWSLNGNQAIMFVTGRESWPAVGTAIKVTETSNTTFNQTWTVVEVKADNSYNTGGTAIKVTAAGSFTGSTSSGGTWGPSAITLAFNTSSSIASGGISGYTITLRNVTGAEENSALWLLAVDSGLAGRTVTVSANVSGTVSAGSLDMVAGQTFTIGSSSVYHGPMDDYLYISYGDSYPPSLDISAITAGSVSVSL